MGLTYGELLGGVLSADAKLCVLYSLCTAMQRRGIHGASAWGSRRLNKVGSVPHTVHVAGVLLDFR